MYAHMTGSRAQAERWEVGRGRHSEGGIAQSDVRGIAQSDGRDGSTALGTASELNSEELNAHSMETKRA